VSTENAKSSGNKNLIIIVSIIIAIVAIAGIALVVMYKSGGKSYSTYTTTTTGSIHKVKTETSETTETTHETEYVRGTVKTSTKEYNEMQYVIKFRKLINVQYAAPLNYPTKDGVVFVAVKTAGGQNQVWTFKDGKLVGTFNLPPKSTPVLDPRLLSYAVRDDKLLIIINNTLYALYGNQTTEIAHIETNGTASFFKKGNGIYAWEIKVKKEDNITKAYCAYYDVLDGVKKVSEYEFTLKNVTTFNVLPDAIDADGCIAIYAKPKEFNVYYWYKGKNGEAKGYYNPMKLHLTTYGPMFLEVKKGETKPYMLMIQMPAPGVMHAFNLYLVDILANRNTSFVLPGLYNIIGMGDFEGKGYVGDVAFVTMSPEGFTLLFVNPSGWEKRINLGALSKSIAWMQGIVYRKNGFIDVLGLGNLTDTKVSVLSNLGKFHFRIENANITGSSLTIIASINGNEMCYSAVINPVTGGLVSKENFNKGSVYLASGCFKGESLS